MVPSKQHYQAYAAARQTVAKTRQIVMLYDGAIRNMQQAADAIRGKRIEERYHLLLKASEIINGLQSCLDFENGGKVAALLYNFYSSIDLKIFSIHRTNSLETCDQVIADLKQMRDAWYEIDQNQVSGGETAAPAPSAQVSGEPEQPAAPASVVISV